MMSFTDQSGSAACRIPRTLRELGAEMPWVFHPMTRQAALHCLRLGVVPSTREQVVNPCFTTLGDPTLVARRASISMPHPFFGVLADYAGFNFTPRTAAAYGSCGPRQLPGAARLRATDMAIAVARLDRLAGCCVPTAYSDRHPVSGATFSVEARLQDVPWALIRASKFGHDADPAARMQYHREVLLWGAAPIGDAEIKFVVADETAAEAFILEGAAMRLRVAKPELRPAFFFGL